MKQHVQATNEARTSIKSVIKGAKTNQSEARRFLLRADEEEDGPQLEVSVNYGSSLRDIRGVRHALCYQREDL